MRTNFQYHAWSSALEISGTENKPFVYMLPCFAAHSTVIGLAACQESFWLTDFCYLVRVIAAELSIARSNERDQIEGFRKRLRVFSKMCKQN